jgi:hypothetical protein
MHAFRAPDGTEWGVEIDVPGSSNAVIIFRHPDGRTVQMDRYNWVLSHGPEARSVTSRLKPEKMMDALSDEEVEKLFRRSMPISRRLPRGRAT